MLSRIIGFFLGTLPTAIAEAESPLTRADRQAILEDLQPLDEVEAGLGEALTAYVVAGEESTALLRLDAAVRSARNWDGAIIQTTLWPPSPWGDEKERQERRRDLHRKLLFGLERRDPSAMRRYGEVLATAYGASKGPRRTKGIS